MPQMIQIMNVQKSLGVAYTYKNKSATSFESLRVNRILTTNKPKEIPPTSDAAKLHISRAFLQAHVWKNAHVPVHNIMSHELMYTGFMLDEKNNIPTPIMMTKFPMPKAVIEIISCNCKFSCDTKKCSCFKSRLRCTIMCHKKSKKICLCTNVNINQKMSQPYHKIYKM